MQRYILPLYLFLLTSVYFLMGNPTLIYAQTATSSATTIDTNSQSEQDVRNRIKELESKITDLKGEEKSLSSQIAVMDSQAKLTELRINSTKQQIADIQSSIAIAGKKITKLEGSLDAITKVLLQRIRATYMASTVQPFQMILSSDSAADLINKEQYLKVMAEHDKSLLYDTQQAKNDYTNQKQLFEEEERKMKSLKVQLEAYTKELDVQKKNKKTLLSQTQGDETNYQKLLSQAKAQLAGFSRFAANQGGSGLLNNQTVCDDWGCYYNQRDSQWGSVPLNGTQYTIATDGCLVTDLAMVLTHYGHKTTPLDINSNSDNFASYYPAYLLYTIRVNGVIATRVNATIDETLASGNPVIVGLYAYGGTHFVVLRSGSNGNYMMNDPFIANGNNVSFNDHYSVKNIFEIDKVVLQ